MLAKIWISVLVAALGAGLTGIGLNKGLADKVGFLRAKDAGEDYPTKEMTRVEVAILISFAAVACFAGAMGIFAYVSDVLGILKMNMAMLCLLGAACFDYREHRIPNFFPALLAVSAVLLLGLGVALQQPGAVAYVTAGAISAIACGLFLVVASVITKQGIGAGDIKLICALALMTGVYGIVGTLFFGVVLCSLTAIVGLLLKKIKKDGALPFGPFLFLGYMITLFAIRY